MPIVPIRRHARNERGFALLHERRSPQAGVPSPVPPLLATPIVNGTGATAPSNPQTALATSLPDNFKGLVGFIVLLGFFILAVAIWNIRIWRRRRANAASNWVTITDEKQAGFTTRIDLEAAMMEKPSKAVLKPIVPPASGGVRWVPQLRADIVLPKPTKRRSKRATKAWEKNLAEFMAPPIAELEPPPSYVVANAVALHKPPMPAIPASPPAQPFPPTPPGALKFTFEDLIPPSPAQEPTPSPVRTSSHGLHPVSESRHSLTKTEKKLPRLMSVEHAFKPSMEDEISVTVGETVRLLEEYEDEWCLIQRVGHIDVQRGIIPRLCLTERPKLVPTQPGRPSTGSSRP